MGKRTPGPKRFDDEDDVYDSIYRANKNKEYKRARSTDRSVKTRSRDQQEDEA
jgi:hypothetical protein